MLLGEETVAALPEFEAPGVDPYDDIGLAEVLVVDVIIPLEEPGGASLLCE